MDRYKLTAECVDDLVSPGTQRRGLWVQPDIDLTGASTYVVTAADQKRLDRIAYQVYADVTYWWVIALVNNIGNPLLDIPVGTVLVIPTEEAITQAFMA